MFTYGSICSGIEAASVAWKGLGEPLWFSEIEPFPCAVLAHHYPDIPNLGDMTALPEKILNHEILAPDVLVGGTPCFTAGHVVLTDKGFTPIENLKVGDLVVTHKGRLKPILRTGRDIKPVGKLSAVGLPDGVISTPEHPFYSQKWETINTKLNGKYHRKVKISPVEWVKAEDMPNRQWVSLTQFSVMPYGGLHSKLSDEEVMSLAGYYLGDGWVRYWTGKNKKAVVLALNHAKYQSFSKNFGRLPHHITEKDSVIKVTICNTELADFLLSQFGEKATGKTIPAWCLSSDYRAQLFAGYMVTDGSRQGNKYSANTVSKSLAYGVAALAQTLGYVTSVAKIHVEPTKIIQGRVVNQQDYYQVRMFPQKTSRKSRIDENRLLRTVRAFTPIGNDVVYNIEVADDNSYIVNNAVVHNCQAFSIAGKRESLNDDRGNLTLALIHILEAIDYVRFNDGKVPCVLVWENVPGVLSTKDNAFGHFLAGLAQETEPLQPTGKRWTNAGYVHGKRTVAWRILDAQHFGVAQRRKRVFVVASARTRSIAQILIEQKGLPRNIKASGITKQNTTAFAESSFGTYCERNVGGTLKRRGGVLDGGSEALIIHGTQDPIISQTTAHCLGRNSGQENVLFDIAHRSDVVRVQKNTTPTLTARMGTGGNNIPCIALAGNTIGRQPQNGGNGNGFDESGVSYTLTNTDVHAVANNTIVRKLTPIECERLQGFPDNYTKIPYRNKSAEECPDSPRYKAIGNSMAVPVMQWIGKRLVDYLKQA